MSPHAAFGAQSVAPPARVTVGRPCYGVNARLGEVLENRNGYRQVRDSEHRPATRLCIDRAEAGGPARTAEINALGLGADELERTHAGECLPARGVREIRTPNRRRSASGRSRRHRSSRPRLRRPRPCAAAVRPRTRAQLGGATDTQLSPNGRPGTVSHGTPVVLTEHWLHRLERASSTLKTAADRAPIRRRPRRATLGQRPADIESAGRVRGAYWRS